MRLMSRMAIGSLVLLMLGMAGCGTSKPIKGSLPSGVSDRGKAPMKQLAMGPGSTREPPLADPVPPPPPKMFPDIPEAPANEDAFVVAATPLPGKSGEVVPASDVVMPGNAVGRGPVERARAVSVDPPAAENNMESLRRLHQRALDRFNQMEGFECRLTRRETIGSRAMPEEVLEYKFRREPYSLHIKWVGLENKGRELIYVAGKYDGKVQILTGKGEGLLVPSGKRVARLPTDSDIRSKSRFDIREGGMGMSIDWFGRVLAIMEKDPAQADRLRYLGLKPRHPEREHGLEAVEETIPPNWEPLLPKGGRRTTFFDPDPASPSFGLPILIVTIGDTGREVEYYWFDQLKPIQPTDADFDADRLWKK
jgi:hypothetical protein